MLMDTMSSIFIVFILLLLIISIKAAATRPKIRTNTNNNYHQHNNINIASGASASTNDHELYRLKENDTIPSSLLSWDTIESTGRISILSVALEHRNDGGWYIPSYHERDSIGWNRSFAKGFMNRPMACNLRFFGLGLESTLSNFTAGGSGFLTLSYKRTSFPPSSPNKEPFESHGYEHNESIKIYCYYHTSKNYGSEFLDTPKTLGIVVYCPITLDMEAGEYQFRNTLPPGYFCRSVSEFTTQIELTLRSSIFKPPQNGMIMHNLDENFNEVEEIKSTFVATPYASRSQYIKDKLLHSTSTQAADASTASSTGSSSSIALSRVHGVCTVQTFRNSQTGPMLYLFITYHLSIGFRVIVYDRFGLHRDFLQSILHLPGLSYHPYTIYQLAQPSKYNAEYAAKLKFDLKYYYKMERNWGYSGKGQADTADQDQDKTRTYDYCRVEYSYLESIMYVDADELFFCPQASASLHAQKVYVQRLFSEFVALGVEEMRVVRIPYSGIAPPDVPKNISRAETDFTNNTQYCMNIAFESQDMLSMLQCWSSATAYDNFPKSIDMGAKCPFHYNHWSCDGMRSGGRDVGHTIPRCRCKVAFDLQNFYEFKPVLNRCHLLHFNDNKYRFQSRRDKHKFDLGSIFEFNPIARMVENGRRKHLDRIPHHFLHRDHNVSHATAGTGTALHRSQVNHNNHNTAAPGRDFVADAGNGFVTSNGVATANTPGHLRRVPRKGPMNMHHANPNDRQGTGPNNYHNLLLLSTE